MDSTDEPGGNRLQASNGPQPLRVLHSFPHRLGKARICTTAWHEIDSAAAAGAEMVVIAGDCVRPFQRPIKVSTTFARGPFRLPYRILGTKRMCAIHDLFVATRLERLKGFIEVVHTWPMAARQTLRAARRLGIPSVLERPNAHTRFAYRIVQEECANLGVTMPPGHEHAFKEDWLRIEEMEYELADYLLCPSDFVAKSFRDFGFPEEKLLRHQYGFDDQVFHPPAAPRGENQSFTMLFAGGCAPRKGLHYALEAWLKSGAHQTGRFLIAGTFIPGYAEKLSGMLNHPSVEVLGQRDDVPSIMRRSDVFVLPSIEEGSALVTSEARGSGCVLLVSDAAGAICLHGHDALVHPSRNVKLLTEQLQCLYRDRSFLARLRAASLNTAPQLNWNAAGRRLIAAYRAAMSQTATRPLPVIL